MVASLLGNDLMNISNSMAIHKFKLPDLGKPNERRRMRESY